MADILNEFGQALIAQTRDKTIVRFEKMVDGSLKTISAKKVQEMLVGFSGEQLAAVEWLIPQIVDSCLHNFLTMCDEENMDILYDGGSVKDNCDGLANELFKADGWIDKFSSK